MAGQVGGYERGVRRSREFLNQVPRFHLGKPRYNHRVWIDYSDLLVEKNFGELRTKVSPGDKEYPKTKMRRALPELM